MSANSHYHMLSAYHLTQFSIMNIETIFCDNYFPPTVIEVIKWKDGSYENRTDYRVPNDGKYGKEVIGVWKVKYKKLNPNYYCEGQRNTGGCL